MSEKASAPAPNDVPSGQGGSSSGVGDAPPAYAEAVNYPTASPYQQPSENPSYPKPNTGYVPPPQYPPQPAYPVTTPGVYPAQIHVVPQPGGIPPTISSTQIGPTAVVINVPALQCTHCGGAVIRETDVCCLVCLILLAIVTFPLGLAFLFCLPCANHNRCTRCHRVG